MSATMIPPSTSTVVVKALNVGQLKCLPASFFFTPVVEGHEFFSGPIYAFLIEHPVKGRVMYDLGLRKDSESLSPAVHRHIESLGGFSVRESMEASTDVPEKLTKGGVDLGSVKAVIWSHTHLDHTGDMSKFPQTTELVVGPGSDLRTYPSDPNATLIESDLAGRKVTELSFSKGSLRIADLPALDYFGDGSFYILDTPGHLAGHVSALARVTPTTFILLGGDCCHHTGDMRPAPPYETHFPLPKHIVQDIAPLRAPMLRIPSRSVYQDVPKTNETLRKLTKLDAHPDILLLIAHDSTVPGVIDEFPASLNAWKEKGWKDKLMWAFLKRESKGFRFAKLAKL